MSIKRGIVTEVTSNSARPISVSSTLPIALVLSSSVVPVGMYGFDSPKKALEFFDDEDELKEDTGNLKKYLLIGKDMFGLIVPTIISVVEVLEDEAQFKAEFINSINIVKSAASMPNMSLLSGGAIGFKPDIIAHGYEKFDMDINNAVINVCTRLKARTHIDLYATSNGESITRRENFGSDRVTVAKCSLTKFNPLTAQTEEYDSGIVLSWLRCFVDGSSSTGYSKSISNRVLTVSGVTAPSEFYAGSLDETDPLTEKQIMSFIHYKGFRTWEYATTSADPIWQDAKRVRIFDLAAEAVIDGVFFAVDKDLSMLNAAKDSLRGFMNGLIGDDVMIGFSVALDLERTTKERITAGEFYFIIDAQEMPSPKLIHITFNRVDAYAGVVYKMLDN